MVDLASFPHHLKAATLSPQMELRAAGPCSLLGPTPVLRNPQLRLNSLDTMKRCFKQR